MEELEDVKLEHSLTMKMLFYNIKCECNIFVVSFYTQDDDAWEKSFSLLQYFCVMYNILYYMSASERRQKKNIVSAENGKTGFGTIHCFRNAAPSDRFIASLWTIRQC